LQKVVRKGSLRVWKTGENACWHAFVLDDNFFSFLQEIDLKIASQVAQAGCPWCGGRLHRSDFERKPRSDLFVAPTVELPQRRLSFCCGVQGCRRRVTPPSVVFLGRRVYLGAVVVVASAVALVRDMVASLAAHAPATQLPATQVPARTLRRWSRWWQAELTVTSLFVALRGLLASPVDTARLPCSLLERLSGGAVEQLTALLKLLAPLTTGSVADGARWLRSAGV
jgi:transposase